ncbi:helix-turn-helix domain-containing protein [Paenibacillus sp. JDR-2]|uniref:helix-turn-helix domain-containing protein n=1 Tax=Paenibacillus sp. (strain JDR-2) TaxID=324057 RepID=UPI000166653D|nr:AraC family transcriptional regulator [Paenibacillus sp. JDR-2]ACT02207.1 transcriptional regulator, AraC family [Paenibacillus sp. JDR-2]
MQTIHKRFEETDKFPFSLVYRDTKSPQRELPDHLHDWYEIVFVYSGTGTFFINHSFYEMNPGDAFLIPGNTVHRAFPDEFSPVTSSAIFFAPRFIQPMEFGESHSLLRCFEQARKSKSYKLETSPDKREAFSGLIDVMNEEWLNRLPSYRAAIAVRLYDFLIALNRMALTETEHTRSSSAEPSWIRTILDYIDAHIGSQEMSLADLSSKASVTYAHFSRVFKQHTGMNVSEYILIKKIMLAKEKLMLTGDTIASVCLACGFESESYFYKKFKLITGMTPVEYRRSCR